MHSNYDTITRGIGDLAVVCTILQFLSGVRVCQQYIKNKSTGESSPFPFISCIISCILWLSYGLTIGEDKIVLVNAIGILLMSGYVIVFYILTQKKTLVKKQLMVSSIMLLLVFIFMSLHIKKESNSISYFLGLNASFFTLVTVAAPMGKLFYVIRVKNTECLPFPFIVMSLVVSCLWALFGYLVEDIFLLYVNVGGTALAFAQLSLFFIYPTSSTSPILPKSKHEIL